MTIFVQSESWLDKYKYNCHHLQHQCNHQYHQYPYQDNYDHEKCDRQIDRHRQAGIIDSRSLEALRALTSSLLPYGPDLGPLGLLEFVLRFLWALLSLLKMWGPNLDRQKSFSEPTVTIGVLDTLKWNKSLTTHYRISIVMHPTSSQKNLQFNHAVRPLHRRWLEPPCPISPQCHHHHNNQHTKKLRRSR